MAVDLPAGWMRQIIGLPRPQMTSHRKIGCVGHFFDAELKKVVSVQLGEVFIRVPFVFRAASSGEQSSNYLSWEEGAAQSAEFLTKSKGQNPVRVLCNTRTLSRMRDFTPRTLSDESESAC